MTDAVMLVLFAVFAVGAAAGFFFLTRGLRRGTRRQPLWVRGPLVILWIGAYLLLVMLLGFLASQLGVGNDTVIPVMSTLVIAGTIALLLLLLYWSRAAARTPVPSPRTPASAFSPISGDISPIPYPSRLAALAAATGQAAAAGATAEISRPRPSLLRCAYDGFALPVRRPLLFVPFVFYMGVIVTLQNMFGARVEPGEPFESPAQWDAVVRALGIAVASLPLFTLAVETTSRMAAEAETGRPVSLATSLQIALRRFPRALAVTILYPLGVAGGFLLLFVPGIIWLVRWILATQAVMLADTGIRQSFRVSAQITRRRWWQFLLLLLIIGLARSFLNAALNLVPPAGTLVSGWLEFSWLTIAMTLAYIRAGGPVQSL